MLRVVFDATETASMMGDRHAQVMKVIVQCRKKYAETEKIAMKPPERPKTSKYRKPAPVSSVSEYLANIGYKMDLAETDNIPTGGGLAEDPLLSWETDDQEQGS
jgi:hypothetical protein